MKRLALPAFFSLFLTQALVAQQSTFVWTGSEAFVQTNNPPPTIDATNFVIANGATFGAEVGQLPFTTSDTLNVTNYGILLGDPGFDFEYFPDQQPPPVPGVPFSNMAGTFANIAEGDVGGRITCTGPAFTPPTTGSSTGISLLAMLKVNATNIIDNGLVTIDNDGLVDFRGIDLDLHRSQFAMSAGAGTIGNATYQVLDWGSGGFGTNSTGWQPATQLTATTAMSAVFTNFSTNGEIMILTNSTAYFQNLNPGGGAGGGGGGGSNTNANTNSVTLVWRVVFLQDFSPSNVTHNVYFDSSATGNGAFHVEWAGAVTDPVTGAVSTNYFYLSDVPVARRVTNFSHTLPPDVQSQPGGEFTLAQSATQQFVNPVTPGFTNPFPASVTNNDFGYLSVLISPDEITNEVVGGDPTNVPGRVQFSASQSLNLNNAQIATPNFLSLNCPVNFEGASNAAIGAIFSSLNLGVTNGLLTISNLLLPNVQSWTGITTAPSAVELVGTSPAGGVADTAMGGLQVWSGSFIFVETNMVNSNAVVDTNDIRILLVNSALQPTSSTLEDNVALHANNVVISDQLNIVGTFSSDAQALTITTNAAVSAPGVVGPFNPFGGISLQSSDIFWSAASLPNLQFLTNFGQIETLNQTFFAGNVFSPYSDLNLATPYQAFINYGSIVNQGTFIRANLFENSGTIEDLGNFGGGSIDIGVSGSAVSTGGSLIAKAGSISISANSLLVSNSVIGAGGGPLTLTVPCSLSDGYVFGNQFAHIVGSGLPNVVTSQNILATTGGINVPVKPPNADLLGTTILVQADGVNGTGNFVSVNTWPGTDRGNSAAGFVGNLAVGQLLLDATTAGCEFLFQGATSNNALYVDSIEFLDFATNMDANGNLTSVIIQPGMKIYYAQAIANGVSIAEQLNGKNGGGFNWVSNYAGAFSSITIPYPDGHTYIFNEALAESPDIVSGGPDGSGTQVNAKNPTPIPTSPTYDFGVSIPSCDSGGNGTGGPGSGSSGSNGSQTLGQLVFPAASPAQNGGNGSSNQPVSFAAAAGSYNGLFYNTNAVSPVSSGCLSATVTPKGSFSAKLQLGSDVYSFASVFDASGNANINNLSGKHLPAINVDLQLVNNDQIMGSVSGNGWTAQLEADRAAFSSKNINNRAAGKDTLLLPSHDENSTASTGEGFGTANISANGSVQWSATLSDGVKVTQKSALSKTGVWPLYSSLYGGSGVFIGWMQCTNQIDIQGSAVWEMPSSAGGLYPGGLTNQIDVVGSRIQGRVGFSGSGFAILSGAGLDPSLTNSVTVGKTVLSASKTFKLSVNSQTGLFNGSVVNPNNNQKLLFQGALLEKSGIGGGFFLNADQSGKVSFGPAN